MLAAERHAVILERLAQQHSVRVSDLVEQLGVSDMTIRRDLDRLHHQGLLEKVHGGATAQEDPSTSEPGFEAKSSLALAQKEAIARRAAALVKPGSSVAISAGTTTHALARHLVNIPSLTVVTNSVWAAEVLYRGGNRDLTVLLTGGLRTPSDALVGPIAITALRSLHLDTVFMGVHGMESRAGYTTPNLMESETNQAMLTSSRRMVVLADSSKWGVRGLSTICPLHEADVVISDTGLPPDAREILGNGLDDLILVEPLEGNEDQESRSGDRLIG